MKKLMNITVLLLVLTGLSAVILNAALAGGFSNDQAGCLSDEPNEPELQGNFIQASVTCLSDDPNEPDDPEFTSALTGTLFVGLDEDPNEPELL